MIDGKKIEKLRKIVGKENVLDSVEQLTAYSYDATNIWSHLPDVVVFPTNTKEVSEVLKFANENGKPVTPRGGGTNVSGGSIPIKGGIILCTTKMDGLLR
jgi:glycolate oxidase